MKHRSTLRLLVLCLIASLLIPLAPMPSAAPVRAAVQAAPVQDPLVLPPPPPSAARSSGLPAAVAEQFRQQYEPRHTLPTGFDGGFSTPRSAPYGVPGSFHLHNDTSSVQHILTLPARSFDSLDVDVSIASVDFDPDNHDIWGSAATLAFRPAGTTTWSNHVLVAVSDGDIRVTKTNQRVTFGWAVPADTPIEVRLLCEGPFGRIPDCTWSNLRFATDVPGWHYIHDGGSYSAGMPLTDMRIGVTANTVQGIAPQNGPFLAVESFNGNWGYLTLESRIIQLPQFSSTMPLTVSVDWARTLTGTPGSMLGAEIIFRTLTNYDQPILATPHVTATTSWQTATSDPLPNFLSGLPVRIRIKLQRGFVPNVLALDSLTLSVGGEQFRIPIDQVVGKCPCAAGGGVQSIFGDPVNTYSGSYYLQATDLAILSAGPALRFDRTYVSMFADTTKYPVTPLGPGWRHSFGAALTLPSQPGGETGYVIYEAPSGNRLRFHDDGTATTLGPVPGVRATLTRASGNYTLTLRDQTVLRFDGQGRLIEQRDSQGHSQTLTYFSAPGAAWDGQLERVTDVSTQRSLTFSYSAVNGQPRLDEVRAPLNQAIQFGYTANGDLATVTDLRGGVTAYGYAGTTHLLTTITDPLLLTGITNTYDSQRRVMRQVEATGLTTTYVYSDTTDGQVTTITRQPPSGPADVFIDHYRPDRSLRFQERNGQFLSYRTFDWNFAPTVQVNGNGHATLIANDIVGQPTQLTDAANRTTTVSYRPDHRPDQFYGPDRVTTQLEYDDAGNVQTVTTQGAGGLPVARSMTYNSANRLQDQTGPDGASTHYTYTPLGQVASITANLRDGVFNPAHPDEDLITTYQYDALGRVVTTTIGVGTALQRSDRTIYNADSTIAATIQNYQDGTFDANQPDRDIITTYGHDLLGRLTWIRDVLGHYTVTHYNSLGRIDWTARNFTAPGFNGGALPALPPAYDPATPDANVATFHGYDPQGRTTLVTETGILTGTFDPALLRWGASTTRITRTEYDAFSRPVTVTLNYRPDLPLGTLPDANLQTITYYDGAGNVTWQRDPFGRWTATEYDVIGRPTRVIANYADGNPTTGTADTDLISVTQYDTAGRVERQIDNYVDGVFSATEPITDRVTFYQYDALSRVITTTLNYAPAASGTALNRVSATAYDPQTARLLGQRDALGRWNIPQYDALGRVMGTIANCRDGDGKPVVQGCDPFDPQWPDRNLQTQTRYDALGRAFETVDPLGQVTHSTYDGLGRLGTAIQHYLAGGSSTADTNVTTGQTYDALGRVITSIDAENATVSTEYNGLGQAVRVTDAGNRVTLLGYDGQGTSRWSRRADGRLTVSQVDRLGRVIATIGNYQDGVVAANEPADQDLVVRTVYDRAGRRVQAIDTSGRVTTFGYDLRDQLISVTENVRANCTAADCNVVTRYRYDRAGNRIAIVDARGNIRRFSYDAAGQQVTATDALGQVTSWSYDAGGRRVEQFDPRSGTGLGEIQYRYDDQDRLTTIWNLADALPIEIHYDALGRRVLLDESVRKTYYEYDQLGRLTEVRPTDMGTVGYGYNARGQRTRLTYPDSTAITYDYWPDSQLHTVTGTTTLASYTYDTAGRLSQVERANGATTSYTYDAADRLRSLITTANAIPVNSFQYDVNRAGLRTVVTETLALASMAADIRTTGTGNSSPGPGITINGTYYFVADDGVHGNELWKSDGTTAGTVLVKDILSGNGGANPQYLTAVNGTLFFAAADGVTGQELWKSDGTAAGTTLVKDIRPGVLGFFQGITVVNNTMFFAVDDGSNGTELWKSDGTATGTVLVKNIFSGSGSSNPQNLTAVNGQLFFATNDGSNGNELWISDGTAAGTTLVKDIRPGSSGAGLQNLKAVSTALFFAANDGTTGQELWKSDGTSAGTVLVKDIEVGSSGSNPANLAAVNGQLFFSAFQSASGGELWTSDGSAAGTVQVKDILSGINSSNPQRLTAVNNTLFFVATDSTSGTELWKSDGTSGGTALVKDIRPGSAYASPLYLTAATGRLFFAANDGTYGQELWTSDGTSAGTTMVQDIVPGSGSSNPNNLGASGPRVFFAANDGTHGTELWRWSLDSRTIHYGYDGLQRLTTAVETPGTTAAYAYDATGNRTDVWINGTLHEHHDYNAANQVVGWTYDAAGNLTGDGTATYEYDTFNRMVSRSQGSVTTSYSYDADGVLVAQERGGVSTEYTQDMAAPLSQVLQIHQGTSTTNELYGLERLAATNGSAKTWYASDALSSVRMTLNDAGAPLAAINYDPWGQVESGNVPAFGFAGELQDSTTGLVNLRARWYSTANGTFTTRDSFSGFPDRPYSQHPYQYASSDPVLRTDPSGHCDRAGDDYCQEIASWDQLRRRFKEFVFIDALDEYGRERGIDPRTAGIWAKAFETYRHKPKLYQGMNDPVRTYAEAFAQNFLHERLNHVVPSGQEAFAELPEDATEEDFWNWVPYQLENNPAYELGQSIGCAINDTKAWAAGRPGVVPLSSLPEASGENASTLATIVPRIPNPVSSSPETWTVPVNESGVHVFMPSQNENFGQVMGEWARVRGSPDRIFHLVTHGAVNAVLLPDGEWGDVKALTQWIRAQPDYEPGMPVNLITCWGGYCERSGIAKELSHELNVPVVGWNEEIPIDPWVPMPPWTERRIFRPDGTYTASRR